MNDLKNKLRNIYLRFPIGDRTRAFIDGISNTFPSVLIAQVLSGITTLYVTRKLGPIEFGRANLSLASTLWIQIPLIAGLPPAMIHYIPQITEEKRRSQFINMALLLSLGLAIVTLGSSYALHGLWAHCLGLETKVVDWGLIWCAGFWVYVLGTTLLS